MTSLRSVSCRYAAFVVLLLAAGCASDLGSARNAGPYVPSSETVVSEMLKIAAVGPDDFVIDLGSGDGRIVLTAAKVFGARGFGVEIQDELVTRSNQAAIRLGVDDRVRFLRQDLFKTDIAQATVLTMYLLPDTVNLLKNKLLLELRPGTRVISHDYPLTGWKPERVMRMDLQDKVKVSGVTTTLIFLYVMPAKVDGAWQARLPASVSTSPARIEFTQRFTEIEGRARIDDRVVALERATLRGDRIEFGLAGRDLRFSGRVRGDAIEGTVEGAGVRAAWRADPASAR